MCITLNSQFVYSSDSKIVTTRDSRRANEKNGVIEICKSGDMCENFD